MANKKINSDLEVSGEISTSGQISSSSNGSFQGNLVVEDEIRLNDDNRINFDKEGDGFAWIKADIQNAEGFGVGAMLYGADNSHHFINGEDFSYVPVTSSKFVTDGATSSQFVKGDGTLDSNTYLSTSLTEGQFLRADAADTKSVGDILFLDNIGVKFGTTDSTRISSDVNFTKFDLDGVNLLVRDAANSFATRFTFGSTTGDLTLATGKINFTDDKGLVWTDTILKDTGAQFQINLLANDFFVKDNGTTRFTFERATGDFTATGSVGIGTTSPSAKLEVVGTISSGEGAGASQLGMDFGGLLDPAAMPSQVRGVIGALNSGTGVTAGSIGYQPRTGVSASHIFFTEQTEKMRIDSDGNVGIGTTTPDAKLHIQNYTTGESHQAIFKGGALTIGDYSYISLSNGYASEYNKEVRLAAVAELGTSNKTGFAVLTSPDTSGASGHERLRITADGDVGIGTDSPGVKLHVADASGEILRLDDSSATGNPFMSFYQDGNRRSLIQHVNGGDMLSLVSEYGGVRIMTGVAGAEESKLEINSAGRAMFAREGITGSMSASIYDVNITGDTFNDKYLAFFTQDGTNNPRTWLKHSSSTSTQELEFNSVFSTGSGYADFAFRKGTTPLLFIDQSASSVGVGTETPGERLHVADDGATTVLIEDTDTTKAATAHLNFKVAGTEVVKMEALTGSSNASTGGGLVVSTATNNSGGYNSSILTLTNGNKVGIGGLLEPRSTLHVNGGIQMADDTDTAISNKVGTLRYRTSGNNSYVDMCMQTGASTYAWVNIQTNSW